MGGLLKNYYELGGTKTYPTVANLKVSLTRIGSKSISVVEL